MQLNSVYLYPNNIDVFTNALGSWQTERYRRVYNRNLKVYRGVDNRIDLQVRNSDEKAVDTGTSVLVFNISSKDVKDLVIQKDCTKDTSTATLGKAYVTLTESDLYQLEPGFYQWSVYLEARTAIDSNNYRVTSRTPMYIDSQYGIVSTLELSGDALGNVAEPSLVINKFSFVDPVTMGYSQVPYQISSIIDTKAHTQTPQSLHTFAVYGTNYSGLIAIQGSLAESASPGDNEMGGWVDIPDAAISPIDNNFNPVGNTITYFNVVGKWNYFRFKQQTHSGAAAVFTVQQTNIGTYIVNLDDGGTSYQANQHLRISGMILGGNSVDNDLDILVTQVDYNGAISAFSWSGYSAMGYKTFVIDGFNVTPSAGTIDKILYR